jgi:hypothetical protein
MKNIHLLPTDKPSRLAYDFDKLILNSRLLSPILYKTQHIYITSDEEIKYDEYYLSWQDYYNPPKYVIYVKSSGVNGDGKKIILTTDPDLIADGVQEIGDEFLEWFVKNPSCEEVEVEIETTSIQLPQQQLSENSYDLAFRWINKKVYKIIIPQEEPKQETLEEAIKREYEARKFNSDFPFDPQSFKLGAKWQQERMYSEEEVKDIMAETWIRCVSSDGNHFKDLRDKILE